jgi:hypothetical protein
VTDDDLDPDSELGFVVADKHTYPGSGKGRGWEHFRLYSARIGPDGETGFGETFWWRILEYDRLGYREPDENFDESEIDHAVEPTDEEEPWRCELGGSELTMSSSGTNIQRMRKTCTW